MTSERQIRIMCIYELVSTYSKSFRRYVMNLQTFYGILIPFLGTSLGSACVFLVKNGLSDRLSRIFTGFAAGVMTAASVWSLLIPSMEQSASMGKLSFLPALIGFWIGVLFLLLLDHVIPENIALE